MKNLLIIACAFCTFVGFSQGDLQKGETQLNGGLGLSSFGLPLYVGLDYGVGKDFTVGGDFSYRSYSDGNSSFYKYTYTIIGIGVNGNYHFNNVLDLPKKFDLYGGATLGYYIWKNSYKYTGGGTQPFFTPNYSGTSGIGYGLQVGGRYFLNDKFGINLEFGGGSFFGGKLGITYKLGGGKGSRKSKSNTKETTVSKVDNTPKETVKPVETKEEPKTTTTKATTKKTTVTTKKKVATTKKKVITKKKK